MATITGRTIFCVLLCLVGFSYGYAVPIDETVSFAADAATEDKCPIECTCQKIEASCIHKGLKEVPIGFSDQVKILILTSNEIEKIGQDTFETGKLYETVSLLLNQNKIKEIHPNAFHILKRLQVVDLGSNELTKLDPNLFVNNTEMLTLRLDNNLNLILPENGPFLNSPTLNELNISNCNIHNLPTDIFSQMPKLDIIDLRGNNITNLNTAALANLTSLIKLSLPFSLKNEVEKICTDLDFLNDLILGQGNSETRINCSPYRNTNNEEISTTDSASTENSTLFDSIDDNGNDDIEDEAELFNSTFNSTNENIPFNSSEDEFSNLTTADLSISNLSVTSLYSTEDETNVTDNIKDVNLIEYNEENIIEDVKNNTSDTDITVPVNGDNNTVKKTKLEFIKDDDTIGSTPITLSPLKADDAQILKETKKIDVMTPSTSKSSGLSGPTVDNIILGFIITAIVVGVVFIIIKKKTKSRKNRKTQETTDEPEGEPLKNMASP